MEEEKKRMCGIFKPNIFIVIAWCIIALYIIYNLYKGNYITLAKISTLYISYVIVLTAISQVLLMIECV